MKVVIAYRTREGREPFMEWLTSLQDKTFRYRVETRIDRMGQGNYGDYKRFLGLLEIRLDFGKGYRLYCGEDGDELILLLTGGDKSSQVKDIRQALDYWRDYHEQKKI